MTATIAGGDAAMGDLSNAEELAQAMSHPVNNIDAENIFSGPGRNSGSTAVRRAIARLFEIVGQFPVWHPPKSQGPRREACAKVAAVRSPTLSLSVGNHHGVVRNDRRQLDDVRSAYLVWLDPTNFEERGQQRARVDTEFLLK